MAVRYIVRGVVPKHRVILEQNLDVMVPTLQSADDAHQPLVGLQKARNDTFKRAVVNHWHHHGDAEIALRIDKHVTQLPVTVYTRSLECFLDGAALGKLGGQRSIRSLVDLPAGMPLRINPLDRNESGHVVEVTRRIEFPIGLRRLTGTHRTMRQPIER